MKFIINIFWIFFGVFFVLTTSYAQKCFPTTINFHVTGWSPAASSKCQVAQFATQEGVLTNIYETRDNQTCSLSAQTMQTKTVNACYGKNGGTLIVVTLKVAPPSPFQPLGTYRSNKFYNSYQGPVITNFPDDYQSN